MARILRHRHLILGFAAAVLMAALALVAIDRWTIRSATANALASARAQTDANAGLFRSELQKYRLLPLILAENTEVLGVLRHPRPATVAQLNRKLKSIAQHTGTAAIYVLDRRGTALVSSNYDLPTSFVGANYAFRSYFVNALLGKPVENFALGTVSRRPGLYLAHRASSGDGVVVAKIEFDRLERQWARQPTITVIRNHSGVVTVASEQAWRLHASRPLPRDRLQEEQRRWQFGAPVPSSLSFTLPPPTAEGEVVTIDRPGRFAVASAPLPVRRWTLSTLEPLGPALAAARTRAMVLGLAALLALVLVCGAAFRTLERRRLLLRSQAELEAQVRERTAELSRANDQLTREVAERERASRRLRKARDELAQANRLGSIGQITAGVAHEINQPVAAIRTFAESARILVTQSEIEEVDLNLGSIVELTARIGRITSELRAFARRDPPLIGVVVLADALEGAVLLMGDRLRGSRVRLSGAEALAGIVVMADRVRLEQVIINLLQNALDAMADTAAPHVRITTHTAEQGKELIVTFHDNGPGIRADLRTSLFRPFVTGKPHGLGLGLGIAQDIARNFGGELTVAASALGGAAFALTLPLA